MHRYLTDYYRIPGLGWKARLEFKLRDAWIGVYFEEGGLTFWVCLIPFFPLHFQRYCYRNMAGK